MNGVSALVLLAVVWFMTLFVLLPVKLETQDDAGERVEGTHAGSPSSRFSMKKKLKLVTVVALPIWAVIASVIVWGGITVEDLDWFDRMGTGD